MKPQISFFKLDEQKRLNALSVEELKKVIEKKPQEQSVYHFTEEIIAN